LLDWEEELPRACISGVPACGQAGNIGRNGSVLTVLDISSEGLRTRNAKGTEGGVRWDTLRDPLSGRVRLSYSDCLAISAVQGAYRDRAHQCAAERKPRGQCQYHLFRGEPPSSTIMAGHVRDAERGTPLGDARPITCNDVSPPWSATSRASRKNHLVLRNAQPAQADLSI
jgi:hypothetical protein